MARVSPNANGWTSENQRTQSANSNFKEEQVITPPLHTNSGWKKLQLLMWKNYKIQSRHILQVFVEIVVPLFFTIVLVIVRDIVKSEYIDKPTIYESFNPNLPPYFVQRECNQIFFAPNNEITSRLMAKMREDFFAGDQLNYTVTGYSDEESLNQAYNDASLAAGHKNLTHVKWSESTITVLAGILFTNTFEITPDNHTAFPNKIEYSIRFPAKQRAHFDLISERFGINPAWFTEIAFPLFQFLGPRAINSKEGGLPGYSEEGFLYLQQAVDRTLVRLLVKSEDLAKVEEFGIRLQRFPYPKYISDKYLFALQAWLPLLTMLSFVYPVLNITKSIVHEKEKRLKESMKMMGLPNYLHWVAWFFKSFIFLIISIFIMTLLIKLRFGTKQDLAVLSGVSFTVLFFILFIFLFQVVGFSFFISSLSSTANSGATAAGVLWFILFTPYFFIHPRYNLLTRQLKIASCFLTNAPIALACQILCVFEGTGSGLQWDTFWQGSGPDDDFCIGDCVTMMFVNATIYFLMTLYIEGVWPGQYGVPLPWNFPFKKSYWVGGSINEPVKPKIDDVTQLITPVQSSLYEAEPHSKAGVCINNLSKKFKDRYVVNNLTLNMYENQITALLGHNGAGKTTTMSMLTGLFPPTSGTALINGFDISTDIVSVRSSLGICPQHDVLFDELTVEEHLRFFSLMKGYPENLVAGEITHMLKSLGLEAKRKAQSHTLSGGMKRKLSVGIALCGGSKVVFLDEPTSGMDPSARRSTWDLIQTEKKGRTVLLSTHFMEEADLLGDRIAIMAEGELQCSGSSLFLKKQYGGGYHLIIVKAPNCEVEAITNILKQSIPDIEIDENIGAELSYSLPDNKSASFPQMFGELEERKEELGIASYGASITTMEEVFVRVGRAAEKRITDEHERQNGHHQDGGVEVAVETIPNGLHGNAHDAQIPVDEGPGDDNNVRNTGGVLFLQQLRAVFVKKCIYAVRNRRLLIGQMCIPALYLLIVMASLKTLPGLVSPPPHLLQLQRYEAISRTVTVVHCSEATPICGGYKVFLKEMDHRTELINGDFIQHILSVGERDLTRLNFKYIVGFEERTLPNGTIQLVGFFNNQPFHSPPLAYNFLTNAILRTYTKYSVETTNHPFSYSNLDVLKDTGTLYTIGFQVGYNIAFGMSFLAASYVVFLITERESGSKHLQFVSGLKFPIFWTANYVVDLISFIFPVLLIFIILLLFQVDDFYNPEVMWNMIILFAAFGASVIPFMYLWSYLFTIPATGFTRMTIFNVFSGIATMLSYVIVSIPDLNLMSVAEMLNNIYIIFPNYALGLGIVKLSSSKLIKAQCISLIQYCSIFKDNICCAEKWNYLAWNTPGIGKNVFGLVMVGAVSFTLLLLKEGKVLALIRALFRKSKDFAEKPNWMEESLAVEDNDVTAENERIRNTNLCDLFMTDNLILRDLRKFYGDFMAVDKLNLGVQRGENFGLLGVNGAGKTTTFKMLTGDIPISSGDAFVAGHSVKNAIKIVHHNLGYCPQFDGIIGEMTGRETLRMFARIRGIPETEIDGLTKRLSTRLIFTQHIDKQVQFYSGGNKRKLSTAMALVGNPPIVFLDEPTTGMDPVARRHLWNAIAQVRESGTSIVLTSHSMEECEALCSRLAIMVNGRFRCLGPPQHLKNKFGEGYTLIAQMAPEGVDKTFTRAKLETGRRRSSSVMLKKIKPAQEWQNVLDPLRKFIEDSFPDSILKDIHPGFVHYHLVPSERVSWGKIFEKMEIAKVKFQLDAYSVGQTSLEQVFLNFTKAQVNVEGAFDTQEKTKKFFFF